VRNARLATPRWPSAILGVCSSDRGDAGERESQSLDTPPIHKLCISPPNVENCVYRPCMSVSAHDPADQADDQGAQALRSAALRQDEIALVHEVFAEEHEAAGESLSGDLAEAHLGAIDKHLQAADEGRAQAQAAREEADAKHD
jgi:hypothetical protein